MWKHSCPGLYGYTSPQSCLYTISSSMIWGSQYHLPLVSVGITWDNVYKMLNAASSREVNNACLLLMHGCFVF